MQPGKSLYTTVREFIENSLDAAEDAGHLPSIEIEMYVSVMIFIDLLPDLSTALTWTDDMVLSALVPHNEISDLYGTAVGF